MNKKLRKILDNRSKVLGNKKLVSERSTGKGGYLNISYKVDGLWFADYQEASDKETLSLYSQTNGTEITDEYVYKYRKGEFISIQTIDVGDFAEIICTTEKNKPVSLEWNFHDFELTIESSEMGWEIMSHMTGEEISYSVDTPNEIFYIEHTGDEDTKIVKYAAIDREEKKILEFRSVDIDSMEWLREDPYSRATKKIKNIPFRGQTDFWDNLAHMASENFNKNGLTRVYFSIMLLIFYGNNIDEEALEDFDKAMAEFQRIAGVNVNVHNVDKNKKLN